MLLAIPNVRILQSGLDPSVIQFTISAQEKFKENSLSFYIHPENKLYTVNILTQQFLFHLIPGFRSIVTIFNNAICKESGIFIWTFYCQKSLPFCLHFPVGEKKSRLACAKQISDCFHFSQNYNTYQSIIKNIRVNCQLKSMSQVDSPLHTQRYTYIHKHTYNALVRTRTQIFSLLR